MRRVLGNPRYRARQSSDVPQYRQFLMQRREPSWRSRLSRGAQDQYNRLRSQMVTELVTFELLPKWVGVDLAGEPDRMVVTMFPGRQHGRSRLWEMVRKAIDRAGLGGKSNVA
jgi:hypothetical protein